MVMLGQDVLAKGRRRFWLSWSWSI